MTDRDGGKVSSSVRLEGWQRDWLKEHNHLNVSELFRQFVEELAGGSTRRPDGLAFREQLLEDEIEDLEATLERKRQQLADVREQLEEREDIGEPVVEEVAKQIKRGAISPVDPDDSRIQAKAERAGMAPEAFVDLLAEHLDGEEWTISSGLKSVDDKTVRFERERLEQGEDPVVVTDGGREDR